MLHGYWSWLRDQTELHSIDGYTRITTPFLDQHNDYIQIYAASDQQGWLLTDDAYTIQDLKASGCDVSTKKRTELLTLTTKRLGVERRGDELVTHTTEEDFAEKKHSLVQAILAVGDLFHTSSATVMSLFLEEVERWLTEHDVRFTESIKFTGRSGLDHHFDFVIPKYREQPERVLQAINRPDRSSVERFIMAWVDTREIRPLESRAVAILNDVSGKVPGKSLEALERYDMQPLLWSQRERYAADLAV